jgi:hypothetical protein
MEGLFTRRRRALTFLDLPMDRRFGEDSWPTSAGAQTEKTRSSSGTKLGRHSYASELAVLSPPERGS